MRASQAVGGAEVELDHTLVGLGLESCRALALGEIARQGNLRGTIGNGTDRVPDHEPSLDQGESTHHGVGGVEHLVEPGPRTAAHHRQGVGHAGGGDQVIGRGLQVGLAQHARGFDEEPGDALGAGVPEHVLVPAGASDAGAVAAGGGEPGIRPRHPADPDLDLGEGAQRRRVDRCLVLGGVERRHVPRPAHDDDISVTVLDRRPDRPAHVRLAPLLGDRRRRAVTHGAHRLGDRPERRQPVAAVLDHVVPPTLGVGLAGGRRQRAERIGRLATGQAGGCEQRVVGTVGGERDGERQIDRADRHAVLVGPPHGLPFRAERGERGEHRPARLVDDVAQQGDRRLEPLGTDPPERGGGLGRRLDEHDRRLELVESGDDRSRRAGPVVPDTEQMHRHACPDQSSARQAS